MPRLVILLLAAAVCGARDMEALAAQAALPPADNVFLVTLDGVRWQEFFGGADRALIARQSGGVRDTARTLAEFWRATPAERRRAAMPFLWDTLAAAGTILGDSAAGSMVEVTNGKWFSYPGYNELLSGAPDDRIDSNGKLPNPNVTILEWLERRPGFRGRVAAFGSWDVLPYIVNSARSGVPANGEGPPVAEPADDADRALNDLAAALPGYWGTVRFDAVTMQGALRYLDTRRPRVLYVMLGDTDEWAHERRYDLYLEGMRTADRFLSRLRAWIERTPGYAGRTALLVTTDHGRGETGEDWTDHGRRVPAAKRIWVAALLPPGGPRLGIPARATQSQVAATVAALLGLEGDFRRDNPKAAPALPIR